MRGFPALAIADDERNLPTADDHGVHGEPRTVVDERLNAAGDDRLEVMGLEQRL